MLGNTLKRLRGIYGYSAKEMSELLGISSSYLSEIENGKKKVSMDLLDRYSELFGLRVSTLVRFSEDYEDVIGEGNWQQLFTEKPEAFARSEQRAYLASLSGVCLGSDAFFPFGDNIERRPEIHHILDVKSDRGVQQWQVEATKLTRVLCIS